MTCGQYCCIRFPLSKYSHTSIYADPRRRERQRGKTYFFSARQLAEVSNGKLFDSIFILLR